MDYSTYEVYDFDNASAFNMSTGYKERSYQTHWHSYGEILLVGPGKTNIYSVGKNTYELVQDDLVLVWPMEMHSIVDADRTEALVIQFSNAFINSLFDLRPAKIISKLGLQAPIYKQTAAFGHFGRPDLDLPWERLDMVDAIKQSL